MADPYSFMVGSAPQGASYASPLIGMALGQQISQYPEQYFQGTQRARTLNLQAPILDPTTGQPSNDPNMIISELQRRGGAEYSEKLLPFIYGAQADQRMADVFAGNQPGGTTQTSSPPSYATPGRANPAQNNPAAASPANLRPPQPVPPSGGNPNDQGANTLRGIATEISGGREISPLISGAARQLGLHPDQPLNLQQAEQVKQFFRNVALPPNPGQGGAQHNPQQTGVDNGGAPYQPVSGATGSAAPSQGQAQAPTTGGPPFAPNANPQAQGTPQGQRVVSPSVQPSDPTLGGLIPQQWVSQGKTASQYRDLLAAMAGGRMVAPGAKEAALARVKAIDEYMAKTGEQAQQSALTDRQLTPEQKNAADPSVLGFEGRKAVQNERVKEGQQQYKAINAQAHQYEGDLKPDLDLLRGVLDDAKLYTGFGADFVMNANRLRAALGGDTTPARLQEMVEKISAKSTLAAINIQRDQAAEAGGSSGRIFKQQIDQINASTYRLPATAAGNRTLVELSDRVGKQGVVLAQMARNYLSAGHLTLDAGYDQQVHDYLTSHPLFTPEEINNTALIAPPLARTSADARAYAQKFPGQPFRVPQEAARQMGVRNAPVRDDGTVVITHLGTR